MTLFWPDLEAKYKREARAEERAEQLAVNSAWYARMQEAKRKGEPFDEPPPWMSDEGGDVNGRR